MSGSNVLGPLVTPGNIAAALKEKAQDWLTLHLADAERAEGLTEGTITRPRGWEFPTERSKWPETQLPTILIVVAAEQNPRPDGEGTLRYDFPIEIAAVVRGIDEADVRRSQSVYGAALRQFCAQRLEDLPPLDVEGATLPMGSYDDIPQFRARSLAMAAFAGTLTLNGVVSRIPAITDLPTDPLEDPGPYPEGVPPARITIDRVDEVPS